MGTTSRAERAGPRVDQLDQPVRCRTCGRVVAMRDLGRRSVEVPSIVHALAVDHEPCCASCGSMDLESVRL